MRERAEPACTSSCYARHHCHAFDLIHAYEKRVIVKFAMESITCMNIDVTDHSL